MRRLPGLEYAKEGGKLISGTSATFETGVDEKIAQTCHGRRDNDRSARRAGFCLIESASTGDCGLNPEIGLDEKSFVGDGKMIEENACWSSSVIDKAQSPSGTVNPT